MKERILIVDDEESSRELCRNALEEPHREIVLCPDARAALDELAKESFDVVLTDMVMPGISGLDLLERIKSAGSDASVLMMSGKGSISVAVRAIQLGAEDFIEKPLPDPEVLMLAVNRVLKARMLERENRELKQELHKLKQEPVLIRGEEFSQVLQMVERIAPLDTTVLLTGETGTGKEVVAHRIHARSNRSTKPFVALNCGGLPQGLLESLLFGHERGAFTGAVKKSIGYFEKADGGTILLDEIGDMPSDLQVKLLRVLQEKTFNRVGGEINIEVDCRVIAATHRNLHEMVEESSFREDLYYRLNVINIHIPPLRERQGDISPLTEHFIRSSAARYNKPVRKISKRALQLLQEYSWPGNIRELQNVLERAVALCSGDVIDVADLPAGIVEIPPESEYFRQRLSYNQAKTEFERRYIQDALAEYKTVASAAKATGIPRQNFYVKMKRLGINLPGV